MSVDPNRRRNPAFHIMEPNPLLGNRVALLLNPEMSRSICELIEQTQLAPEQKHLYAFGKRLRTHYYKMAQMYQDKAEVGEEIVPSLDSSEVLA
jgi:hypothetical protein